MTRTSTPAVWQAVSLLSLTALTSSCGHAEKIRITDDLPNAGALTEADATRNAGLAADAGAGEDDATVHEQARSVSEPPRGQSIDEKLAFAAWLGRNGHTRERDELLREIFAAVFPHAEGSASGHARPPPPAGTASRGTRNAVRPGRDFRVVGTTFATEIRGARDFEKATDAVFRPGETIEIYGEFAGFAEEIEKEDEDFIHIRRFQASLRLANARRQVVDIVEFLPARDGLQRAPDSETPVNFWARYSLAEDLPPGIYHVLISARDLIGDQSAAARLQFDIRTVDPAVRIHAPEESLDAADSGR